ncbi:hypothetical protein TSOC_001314 [Tetrabaena socialis]|uniref:Ankyrin repeat domain-containing protein n=1 Tax=Tetrabaena socialis TaxID=47790 RepID=A0A2J8AH26_9CHLO|nr:hypothetical protein TSOC_001314 [Tetrabaena socialis]|eukprot:PNH11828.1 hypothetical protein TSOC_001314 [Tetrabaena socialis]
MATRERPLPPANAAYTTVASTAGPWSPAAPLTESMGSREARSASPTSPPLQQLQPTTRPDPSRFWLPEIVQRFAASPSPNEVACALRLVNKATAVQFRGLQHTTVRLSQPVPHHAFVRRWASPDAMRTLARQQRIELSCLTARSGSVANLEVLLARDDLGVDAYEFQDALLNSAVEAGQLGVCAWLRQRGWHLGTRLVHAAACGGQQAVYEWLLANGCSDKNEMQAAAQAAKGGHVHMMDWLLLGATTPRETPLHESAALLCAVAAGCDLPTLQRLHHAYLDSRGGELPDRWRQGVVSAAAESPTADWRAKVEWLEAQGYPRAAWLDPTALDMPDVPRLHMEALQYVLGQGVVSCADARLMVRAAQGGHVAIMEVLHARGVPASRDATHSAAGGGHVPAMAWLVERLGADAALAAGVERLGADAALAAGVFTRAAAVGSMALMVWLQELGCPWDEYTFAAAAKCGSEEQLEWLAERGCPMGDDVVRTLCWLLDQGCPVDWDQAEATAEGQDTEGLLEWLQRQRQQRA